MGVRVAVIGGGIAGLAAASTLRAMLPDAELVVLEASGQVGGKIGSRREKGFLTEDGPQLILERDGGVRALAGSVGLVVTPLAAGTAVNYVVVRGKPEPAPDGLLALLRTSLLSRSAKWELAARIFRSAVGSGADESVLAFSVRHLGEEAGRLFAHAVARGFFGGDPERLSIQATLPHLAAMEAHALSLVPGVLSPRDNGEATPLRGSFDGGLATFPRALANALGKAVLTGSPVSVITPRSGGWEITWSGPSAGTGWFQGLVLALPASAAALLLAGSGAPACAAAAERLATIRYAPLSVVHLGYRRKALARLPTGARALAADGSLGINGCLFMSNAFPDRAPEGCSLVTAILSGAQTNGDPERHVADSARRAQSAVGALLAAEEEPIYTRVVGHATAIPQYDVGHLARVAEIERLLAPFPSLALAGAQLRGIGVADAASSGVQAANRLAATLPAASGPWQALLAQAASRA